MGVQHFSDFHGKLRCFVATSWMDEMVGMEAIPRVLEWDSFRIELEGLPVIGAVRIRETEQTAGFWVFYRVTARLAYRVIAEYGAMATKYRGQRALRWGTGTLSICVWIWIAAKCLCSASSIGIIHNRQSINIQCIASKRLQSMNTLIYGERTDWDVHWDGKDSRWRLWNIPQCLLRNGGDFNPIHFVYDPFVHRKLVFL